MPKSILYIICLSFSLHVAYFIFSDPELHHFPMDEGTYLELAERITEGKGLSLEQPPFYVPESGKPTMFWTPVYPYLLAFFKWLPFSTKQSLFLFQSVLASLLPGAVYIIFSSFLSFQLTRLLVFLVGIYPFYFVMPMHVASETITAFLFAASLALSMGSPKGGPWIHGLFGLTGGILLLTRPEFLFAVLLILLWKSALGIRNGSKTAVVTMLVVFSLILSTWLYRNYRVSGELIFSTRASYSLLFQNKIYSMVAQGELDHPDTYFDSLPKLSSEVERNEYLTAQFVQWFAENPFAYAKACFRRAAAIVTPYFAKQIFKRILGLHDVGQKTSYVTPPILFVIANDLFVLLFWSAFVTGLFRFLKNHGWNHVPLGSPIILLIGICLLQYAIHVLVIHTWYQRSITDPYVIGIGLFFHQIASKVKAV